MRVIIGLLMKMMVASDERVIEFSDDDDGGTDDDKHDDGSDGLIDGYNEMSAREKQILNGVKSPQTKNHLIPNQSYHQLLKLFFVGFYLKWRESSFVSRIPLISSHLFFFKER